jgi:hypothetical protein
VPGHLVAERLGAWKDDTAVNVKPFDELALDLGALRAR